MAFSLLSHIKQNNRQQLTGILPALDAAQKSQLIAFTLAHLVVLNRQDTAQSYRQIKSKDLDFFWQGIDQQAFSDQLATHGFPTSLNETTQLINHVLAYIYQDINDIDDTASLEQDGVSELIEGQVEHLSGAAPDWLWLIAGLPELQGQQAEKTESIDIQTSIASLSKMMHDAASHSHVDEFHDAHGHHEPQHIELPPQREASLFFKVLEPLAALAILLYVLFWFLCYHGS